MQTLKTIAFRLVLMGIATLLALLVGEVLFRSLTNVDPRFYNTASTQHIIRPDTDDAKLNPFDLPVAMRTTIPNADGFNVGKRAVINRHGMRDASDYSFKKEPGTRRVMMVGDSVLFGHTEQEDLIPPLVRKHLEKRTGEKVEVPAFSCPGWAFNPELIVVKQAVSKFELDDLVVLFVLNDLTGRKMWFGKDGEPDHEMQLGSYDRNVDGSMQWVRSIIRQSSLLTAVAWSLKGVYARRQPMDDSLEVIADDTRIAKTVGAMDNGLRWLSNHCKKRKIRCTLAIVPYAVQYSEAIGRKVIEQWYGRPYNEKVLRRAVQDALMASCKKHGLRCLDMWEGFAAADDLASLFFQTPEGRFDYVHLSAKGNDLAGKLIAEHLATDLPEATTETKTP